MKIAVEGCCHGELDKIYETLQFLERKENIKVDLLLCCGDFQAVRNEADLKCMAVPPKYRQMQTFYKYYSGEKKAPVLTVFIGGNHEASNHLGELPYGGWVAPNIYYLGYSGVVTFGGYRIAGLSGIYKKHDYPKGHFERPPFHNSSVRSAYHIRSIDVFKLKLLSQPLDIVMSHDWPLGVYHHGNVQELYRYKSFLRDEIESNTLGSPPAAELLDVLQPDYWYSAHLHVKFPALVPQANKEGNKMTKFLALDKCLPRRDFLQVVDVGTAKGPLELHYDAEWLAITRLTNELMNITSNHTILPSSPDEISKYKPSKDQVQELQNLLKNGLKVPENFVQTVPLYNPKRHNKYASPKEVHNPQTSEFCEMLGGMENLFTAEGEREKVANANNPDEIDLSDDGEGDDGDTKLPSGNPDEINLDAEDDEDELSLTNLQASDSVKRGSMIDDAENGKDSNKLDNNLIEGADSLTSETEQFEPPKKAFKLIRRNQTMYTSHDSDDND